MWHHRLPSVELVRQQAHPLQEEHRQGPGGGESVRRQEGRRCLAVLDGWPAEWCGHSDDVARTRPGLDGLLARVRRIRPAAGVRRQHGVRPDGWPPGSESLRCGVLERRCCSGAPVCLSDPA